MLLKQGRLGLAPKVERGGERLRSSSRKNRVHPFETPALESASPSLPTTKLCRRILLALTGIYSRVSARVVALRTGSSCTWELAVNTEPQGLPWTSWI